MRLLHSSDWHLSNRGTIAGRFVLHDGMNLTLVDRVQAIGRICEYAEENDVDLVCIAGDLFDHSNPEAIAIRAAVEAIERLAEVSPVVIVKGNHDGQKAAEHASALAPFGSLMKRFGIYVSERPDIFSILIKGQKINIFTLPYPRRSALKSDPQFKSMSPEEISVFIGRKMEEILAGFQARIERDAVNVLVGHFTVAGSIYSKEQSVPPFDISVRKEFLDKINVVCLGHLHEPQQYYSGAIARNGFGEQDMKPGFKVYEVQAQGVVEQFIELPAREYLTLPVEDFLKSSNGIKPDAAVRIKGRAPKHLYDDVVRKMRSLGVPFIKNQVEVELETAGAASSGDVSEEPDVDTAIRMWAAGRDGMDKFLDRLIETAREVETKYQEEVGR